MDYNQLKAFIAVAETGSFSMAAENLRLTQPAVSKRVALLEAHLGSTLFDRVGKQNRLTAAGELALVGARRIIGEAKALEHDIENLTGSISGKLVISTSHHIGRMRANAGPATRLLCTNWQWGRSGWLWPSQSELRLQ